MKQNELFKTEGQSPLAEKLRPQTLEDIVGQENLLGKDKPLYLAFKTKKVHSMILWGPPGVGKTTLARLAADAFDGEFIALSAVFSGVKEVKEAILQAQINRQNGKQTILFIDEIHRFNKAQQDSLLPFIESGDIVFIGATTENPSFELNRALLSRTTVYTLERIGDNALKILLDKLLSENYPNLTIEKKATDFLIDYADGDARRLINTFEQVAFYAEIQNFNTLDYSNITAILTKQGKAFDKNGDQFYELISALHKSVRGSNPDAALYWFMRMLEGGVDPLYLARRIVRIAWEDIGLADPRAMQIANDAATTYERLGSPEGELALGQAVLYLASAAKSNAGYKAFNEVREFVRTTPSYLVPMHLRNAPTKMMKEMDYGKNYRYAHDEPNAYAAGETYLPEEALGNSWYKPVDRGLEKKIKEKLEYLKVLDKEVRGQ